MKIIQLQKFTFIYIQMWTQSTADHYGSANVRKMHPGGKYLSSSQDKQLSIYCCLLWILRPRIIRPYGKEAHWAPRQRCQSRAFNRLYDWDLSRCFLCNQRPTWRPITSTEWQDDNITGVFPLPSWAPQASPCPQQFTPIKWLYLV